MKNVLITGGAGFIGSNFIHYLLKRNPEVNIINLDLLTYAGHLENLFDIKDDPRYTFIEGDIRKIDLLHKIFQQFNFDTVIHFAAETHVDRSIEGPSAFIETNILGTFNLLQAARLYWQNNENNTENRFHHVSTDEVFGMLGLDDPAFKETTPYAPSSPYSASKASSDHLVRSYYHTYHLPISITNCSNNYGPYQYPEKLIPLMIINAINGKPLPVYGDGQQIRDWLHVEDHCEAIYEVLLKGKIGETYNVGGENQPTNLEIVELICDSLDEKLIESPNVPHNQLISFVKDRPGHDFRYAMDINKIKNELGWKPKHSLRDGIKETIDWYLQNEKWLMDVTGEPTYMDWISKNYHKRGENND